jgi:hypothetical protein
MSASYIPYILYAIMIMIIIILFLLLHIMKNVRQEFYESSTSSTSQDCPDPTLPEYDLEDTKEVIRKYTVERGEDGKCREICVATAPYICDMRYSRDRRILENGNHTAWKYVK